MILIALLLTLIIIISYPFIGYKLFQAIRNREKKKVRRVSIILIVLILLPGFFWRVLPGSDFIWRPIDRIYEKDYNGKLTGLEFYDGPLIFEYHSERAFNGDGYSIWIFELDDETATYFQKPKATFFTNYPSSGLRNGWKTERWKSTPADSSEQKFIDFAYTSLPRLDFELDDLLKEKGNFYAYSHYSTHGIGNVDFAIICPKRKLLVEINHNT